MSKARNNNKKSLMMARLFFEPLGPQSGEIEILTPAWSAATTSVVSPYNRRLDSGDQTKSEPTLAILPNWEASRAVP